MTLALRSRPRALVLAFVLVILAGAFVVLAANPVQAQEPTGASATKDCPPATPGDPYTIGDSVTCTYTFENEGFFAAEVTTMSETQPSPGGTTTDVSCTLPDGTTVVTVGGTLPPGETCSGSVEVNIPNDPALCNTLFRDRVEVELLYDQFGVPLTAGAFATHTLAVLCPPEITVTKVADEFSKVGDDVTYTIEVCNVGPVEATRDSVSDTLLGDISASFAASLAPGACDEVQLTRTVLAGDPDPLVNTVTATYSVSVVLPPPIPPLTLTDTATASASTDLFQPAVDVTKACTPDPIEVGTVETCTIVVTNTGSADSPDLENGTIDDTLTGDLLDPTNTAVASSDCTAALPTGGTCTITTTRTVLDSDPSPLVNTVTVHYNPIGFPNDITDSATASVTVVVPAITVTKVADEFSKVGDDVTYTIEVCNVGPVGVTRDSVSDTLLGDISASFAASLAPGACDEVQLTRTVLAGDPDPLENTVTATYSGAASQATATASASTDLFQPAVDVTKACTPDPIEVGTVETCTIVVTNTGSADSPDLENGTISDTLTGDLLDPTNTAVASSDCTAALPTGGTCTITTTRTVLDSDPSPLVNTVTVHYNPIGFPNDITDSATASVTVVVPAITVTKVADEFSKVGDDVTYTIEVCNVGPVGVTRDSVSDTLLGDISASFAASLAPGACDEVQLTRTVLAGDPDPLENTVTATYSGAASQATATASASTDLFQPAVDVTKACTPDPVAVGAVETCTIVVTNTGSADSPDLENGTIDDTLTGDLLDPTNTAVASSDCTAALPTGGTCTITTTRTVLDSDPSPLVNTVTVHYNPIGFPNDITDAATASVTVERPGGEGCTPGFWKQTQHFDSWTGFAPGDSFEAVFGVDVTLRAPGPGNVTIDDPTLLDALQAPGGGVNALARHAVSALLNASNPDVSSDFTPAEVIALVQDAVASGDFETAKNLLAAANEQGCPLS